MLVGNVIGNVWATRKHQGLDGNKLMVVEPTRFDGYAPRPPLVAVDIIGAGIGDTVLVVSGSAARLPLRDSLAPVDAVIIAIVDKVMT